MDYHLGMLKQETAERKPVILAFGLGVLLTICFFLPEILGVAGPGAEARRAGQLASPRRLHQLDAGGHAMHRNPSNHLTHHTGCTFGANRPSSKRLMIRLWDGGQRC
jgi:hypothetical protein